MRKEKSNLQLRGTKQAIASTATSLRGGTPKQTSAFLLVCFAALAMTMAACAHDDAAGPATDATTGTPVSFTATSDASSLRGAEGDEANQRISSGLLRYARNDAATRTLTTGTATTWLTDDEIGIFMTTGYVLPATIVEGGDNVKYHPATEGGNVSLTPADAPIRWPEEVRDYGFIAYYPRLEVGPGGIDPDDYTYPLDVSDQSKPEKLDLLWAITARSYGDDVSFYFNHAMSKLRVNLTAGSGFTAADFEGCTARADGMPVTGKFSLDPTEADRFPDKGNIAPIDLPAATPGEGYAAAFEAIVIPQDGGEFRGRTLQFTLAGGGDYYWPIPDNEGIVSGVIHTYNLTISRDGVTFAGSTIAPWTTAVAGQGEAEPFAVQPPANSYMLAPGSDPVLIPISQANRVLTDDALGAATDGLGSVTAGSYDVELVWGDLPVESGGVIRAMRPYETDGNYIYLEPGPAPGNAVIAIRDKTDGNIRWSWHIWVTPAVGEAKDPATGLTWMDRNLGAKGTAYQQDGANGLFYQWGRKDAFPVGNGSIGTGYTPPQLYFTETGPTNANPDGGSFTDLPGMVQNPFTFAMNSPTYRGSLNVEADNDSWGGVSGAKTLYDPCPPGWKVPPYWVNGANSWGDSEDPFEEGIATADWDAFKDYGKVFRSGSVNHYYPAAGYYDDAAANPVLRDPGHIALYWSATPNRLELYNPDGVMLPALTRASGYSIRCVRE